VLKPPSRRTAADEAELAVFQGIMDGTIPPGSPLRLQDLADQLDMSMMPIREAIRRLQGLGLVEVVAHKGAWVRTLSIADLYDTYATRIHHEALALSMAARRITKDEADTARAALDEMYEAEAAGEWLRRRDAHERFHFGMYEASGSTWLVHSIRPVWRNSERYRVESLRHPQHIRERAVEHRAILAALEAGDGKAAVEGIVTHLRATMSVVDRRLREEGDVPADLPVFDDLLAAAVDLTAITR
jgi:DNA-binding GntR family transcriptional regulator